MIVGGTVTVTVAVPDLLVSQVEVAVMVAVPAPEGVNTPDEMIVPPVADHVTTVLKTPVPWTAAEQVDVRVVQMLAGMHEAPTDVIVGDACVLLPTPLPPHPATHKRPTKERPKRNLHRVDSSSTPPCLGKISAEMSLARVRRPNSIRIRWKYNVSSTYFPGIDGRGAGRHLECPIFCAVG